MVASPESGKVRTEKEIGKDEILDFETISYDGNLPHWKKTKKIFKKWKETDRIRIRNLPANQHEKVRHRMMVQDGEIRSHLTEKYPECVHIIDNPKCKVKREKKAK